MFEALSALPSDPILGLMAAYREDPNTQKVDLGVGVYRDNDGNTPILNCVLTAQQRHTQSELTKSYIGPPGEADFNTAVQRLLFGAEHAALRDGRVGSAQTPGGCGALRVAAELVNRARPGARIWVSDPTWANHIPLLGDAGLKVESYPYFDRSTSGLRFDDMMSALQSVGAGDLVLLHGCCHNPCGVDLNAEQWATVAKTTVERGFTPFIDIAYQGLSNGIDEDATGVRVMADQVPELIVASSCSKNFGLYRERVGSLAIMSKNPTESAAVLSQMLNVIRGIYSMPPNHGGAIVKTILNDPELTAQWHLELTEMRDRINGLRDQFASKLAAQIDQNSFDFIRQQRGMFSFLGIDQKQIAVLRDKYSIYMVDSSRINVAGLNSKNIDYVCDAISAVL
ncbi:MAG: aspartate aminotransferase [Gammaproteobacteria bacterium]|jgi:aspartate aminotransferase